MKRLLSLLAASILSLYTFYSTCWYTASSFFNMAVPFVFAALLAYVLLMYVVFRRVSKRS
ncbi:hypothetical protein Mpsy_0385 [Methanolobus psychrophilus R15]|nr:hypothetical protein Mpsy_0385 [Methanolobus psychrophilus R15]